MGTSGLADNKRLGAIRKPDAPTQLLIARLSVIASKSDF